MKPFSILLCCTALQPVTAIGFTTYAQILEGTDNSGTVAYSAPDRSSTLFLYIQIIAGSDHSQIIEDFQTLAQNYGSQGVGVIPRVRYGNSDGSIATEPDESILMSDVSTWAGVFAGVSNTIDIPVIQAGFLGEWGEWHDGQYCKAQGTADSPANQAIKTQVVNTLLASGRKVALRYPQDHSALFNGNRTITIHDDCIFDGGLTGYDGGTFPADNRTFWVDYTTQVASNNSLGGEGCDDAGDATFNWSDWTTLCGDDGLITYINTMGIAYLNAYNPSGLQNLFEDADEDQCSQAIQQALEQFS